MRTEIEAAALPASRGCRIVYPEPNQLFIDIDSDRQWRNFCEAIERFKDWRWQSSRSTSGKPYRKHVVVTLPKAVDERTRVFYQALLGSDPSRESLSWKRLQAGEKRPTIFFEKIVNDYEVPFG